MRKSSWQGQAHYYTLTGFILAYIVVAGLAPAMKIALDKNQGITLLL
jgi:hypothetical protein